MSNPTPEQRTATLKIVDSMAADPDVIAIVKKIESGIKTTQGNYGKYMATLSGIADRTSRNILAAAFIAAGADSGGVKAAMRIIG